MKTEVIIKGTAMVLIAILIPWSDLFADAVKQGDWPTNLNYAYRSFASALAGLNALVAFMSGTYERSKNGKHQPNPSTLNNQPSTNQ